MATKFYAFRVDCGLGLGILVVEEEEEDRGPALTYLGKGSHWLEGLTILGRPTLFWLMYRSQFTGSRLVENQLDRYIAIDPNVRLSFCEFSFRTKSSLVAIPPQTEICKRMFALVLVLDHC